MKPFDIQWEELDAGKGYQRVDSVHPLDFYLGKEISGEWILLLVSDHQAELPQETQAINVSCLERKDGRWAIVFKLTMSELGKVFAHLCEDLVAFGRTLDASSNYSDAVIKRYFRWQRLLLKSPSGLMDKSSQLGLLGELLFLEKYAMDKYSKLQAVEGWIGPLETPQDFKYSAEVIEIKTATVSSTTVNISSAEQLDISGDTLKLVIEIVEKVEKGKASFTLKSLIDKIKNNLESDSIAYQLFEDRLLSAGYIDREEYNSRKYVHKNTRCFSVGFDFPKITRTRLPSAIGQVKYELSLDALDSFEIALQEG